VRRFIGIVTAVLYLACTALSGFAQETTSNISQDSSKDSAQESSRSSMDQSSENSSDSDSFAESSRSSSEQSTANSSDDSSESGSSRTSSEQSTENSSDNSSETTGLSEMLSIVIVGAVVVVAVVGVVLTVTAKKVKEEPVVGLQDQIYLAKGRDYEAIREYFDLKDSDIVSANDELVAEGYVIVDDQSAADYLAALMLKCAERSEKIKADLAM